MAERTRGLYSALSSSRIYSAVQTLLAGRQSGRFLLEEHYRLPESGIVLDVGCGPGVLVESVAPECRYFGFDPNADYIAKASARGRGTFVCGTMSEFLQQHGEELKGSVDVIVCCGVLHHLTDAQSHELLQGCHSLLKSGGRLACLEPTKLIRQDKLSRLMQSFDRGANIRFDYQWVRLLREHFTCVESQVANNFNWIPWVHILLTAVR